jgi:hypothetical protein
MGAGEPPGGSWFGLRYQRDGSVREVKAQLPKWFVLWLVVTTANAFGFTEPAKVAVRHLLGIAGCG